MKQSYFLGLSEEGFHRVAYTEWGEESVPNRPIICAHGLTRNGRDFDDLAYFLSQANKHVYCPDVVGRGESDWLNNPLHYTYEQYIADMNALIALTKAREIDWIGTSMGGILGMFLASLPKNPIKTLVLNDIGSFIPSTGLARLAKYAGFDPDFSTFDEAKNYYKTIYSDFGNLTDAQWQTFTEHSVRQTAENKYVSKLDPAVNMGPTKSKLAWQVLLHPLKAIEGSLFDIDLSYIWEKVTCPVLIIHGKKSDLLLPKTIEKMKQTNTHIEVIEVEDAGHAPAILESKQHELIYAWIERHQNS